jgi:hypothetical protein
MAKVRTLAFAFLGPYLGLVLGGLFVWFLPNGSIALFLPILGAFLSTCFIAELIVRKVKIGEIKEAAYNYLVLSFGSLALLPVLLVIGGIVFDKEELAYAFFFLPFSIISTIIAFCIFVLRVSFIRNKKDLGHNHGV